jgi:beta-glucosidase
MDGHQNRWFLDPVLRGAYPADLLDFYTRRFGELDVTGLELAARPIDFLGVNYYSPALIRAATAAAPLLAEPVPAQPPRTAMGWPVDADGLYDVLVRLRREYGAPTIYITENGAAFDDESLVDGVVEDPSRVAYLADHLHALRRAMADGVDVRRYHVWSLLDNFEWEHGYSKRFGIVRVDYGTQERVLKRSALWYRDHIAATRGR